MSVINPRNRLVNFRLSETEFEKLKAACLRDGARSISEFARTAVLCSLEDPAEANQHASDRVGRLDHKVKELEIRVEQLMRLLAVTGGPPIETSIPAGVAADPEHSSSQ